MFLEAFRVPFVTAAETASNRRLVAGCRSQTLQDGGRRGGLTSRQIRRVHCLPGTSANSGTHAAAFDSTATRAQLEFPPQVIFLKIERVSNIITC
jgi:hypothetical protein